MDSYHRRAFPDPPEGLAEGSGTADKRAPEIVLVDVVVVVGGGENLALVDVIDAGGFENLGFDEVADAGAGEDGDRDGAFDVFDEGRVGHAGNGGAEGVGDGDGACAGLFGDLGLVRGGDLENGAAAECLDGSEFEGVGVLFWIGDDGGVVEGDCSSVFFSHCRQVFVEMPQRDEQWCVCVCVVWFSGK